MHLSRLYIENFRSIKSIDIKFEEGKNIIVGRNNSGKSNVLKAIDLILGEYSPAYNKSENVTDNDFHGGQTMKPIFIWCEITRGSDGEGEPEKLNLEPNLKSTFYRLYKDKQHSIEHRVKISTFNKEEKIELFKLTSEKGQASIDEGEYVKKWVGGKPYCKGWTFDHEFKNITRFGLAFYAYKGKDGVIKKDMVFIYREQEDQDWIIGFNCGIRNSLIQSAIIPAFRDPRDQLRINSYTWYGKLLKAYVKTDTKELADAFNSVKKASNEIFKNLRDKISEKEIDIAFPNTSISFQFNPDTKQDIHKSTLIYVDDGFNSELKDKGAGIQSAVTISLYDFYVRHISHTGSSLLAVEEPELYLHPHGRRVISNRLSKFVNGGKNQVIITTHSPEFVSSIHETQNIISVTKKNAATTAKNIYFNTSKRKQILIKKQNSEIFFADAVILSEGADKYFIEESARCFGRKTNIISPDGELILLGENWVNDYNISIINCGGKTELWKYAEILSELEIDYVTTADFDFLRDGLSEYFTKLNYNKEYCDQLNAIKSKVSKAINGKYKFLAQLEDENLKVEVQEYLRSIQELDIFVFSGELENFYIIKPMATKEGGVIETLGSLIDQSRPFEDFVDVSEYDGLFIQFLKSKWGCDIYQEPA